MADYKIPIDTFVQETFECKASVCAILTGAALSFQDTNLRTRMAFHSACQHFEHRASDISGHSHHRV